LIFVTYQYNIILDAWPYSHWLATADLRHAAVVVARSLT